LNKSQKAKEQFEVIRLKQELWKAEARESEARETISRLQKKIESGWRHYPIASHPKVILLLESFATIMAILQQYEEKKDINSAEKALYQIKAELDRLLKNNQNIKDQEKEFVSNLDKKRSRDSIISDLEDGMRRQKECIDKINEIAESLSQNLDNRARS
jgi:hypothetical protein